MKQDFTFDDEPKAAIEKPVCEVNKTMQVKYPPVVMTYAEDKMQREISKIREKIMQQFSGLPMFWFDFKYDVKTEEDGKVTMTVTACLKEDYKRKFEENRDKLYQMLEDGA